MDRKGLGLVFVHSSTRDGRLRKNGDTSVAESRGLYRVGCALARARRYRGKGMSVAWPRQLPRGARGRDRLRSCDRSSCPRRDNDREIADAARCWRAGHGQRCRAERFGHCARVKCVLGTRARIARCYRGAALRRRATSCCASGRAGVAASTATAAAGSVSPPALARVVRACSVAAAQTCAHARHRTTG